MNFDLDRDAIVPEWQLSGFRSIEHWEQAMACITALLDDRRHVLLSCANASLLEDYSRRLVHLLRQKPQVRIFPYLPSNTEQLLSKFNELVAGLPMDKAIDRKQPGRGDLHIFLVQDHPLLDVNELGLLVRLVNDLPGANIRILLILDPSIALESRLKLLGKWTWHWSIPGPPETVPSAAPADWRSAFATAQPSEVQAGSPKALPHKPRAGRRGRVSAALARIRWMWWIGIGLGTTVAFLGGWMVSDPQQLEAQIRQWGQSYPLTAEEKTGPQIAPVPSPLKPTASDPAHPHLSSLPVGSSVVSGRLVSGGVQTLPIPDVPPVQSIDSTETIELVRKDRSSVNSQATP